MGSRRPLNKTGDREIATGLCSTHLNTRFKIKRTQGKG
jgi:hypothetical protein